MSKKITKSYFLVKSPVLDGAFYMGNIDKAKKRNLSLGIVKGLFINKAFRLIGYFI